MSEVLEPRAREALVREVLERAGDPEFGRWREQLRTAGYCRAPVRLRGAIDRVDPVTGARTRVYDTSREPERVLLKACGNRRASVCPPCSEVYQRDAYQLVAAGIRGGKGVPESVAEHPMVFATLTAPGFGAVHTTPTADPLRGRCLPRRGKCPHGRPLGCWGWHRPDDPSLGRPLCPECFDYDGQARWNAGASELWRRTTIYIRRALAGICGRTQAEVNRSVRLSYVKVAEYQRRGALHFHAVFRLDGRAAGAGEYTRPGPLFTAPRLAEAVESAAEAVRAPSTVGRLIRWGEERVVEVVEADAKRVARYIAKYTTKSADDLDVCKSGDEHLRRCAEAARRVGERGGLTAKSLERMIEGLGYRGHWTTKSRQYSTTLAALRQARIDHARDAGQSGAGDEGEGLIEADWRYSGRGYRREGDRWLAETAHRAKQQAKAAAWLERSGSLGAELDGGEGPWPRT